jgi:hypothetical protein
MLLLWCGAVSCSAEIGACLNRVFFALAQPRKHRCPAPADTRTRELDGLREPAFTAHAPERCTVQGESAKQFFARHDALVVGRERGFRCAFRHDSQFNHVDTVAPPYRDGLADLFTPLVSVA